MKSAVRPAGFAQSVQGGRMRKLSSVFAVVGLLLVAGPLPARACTTDADCDNGNMYGMPSSNWSYSGTLGGHLVYVYKDLHGLVGPIRLAVVRDGQPTKLKGSGAALNFTLAGDPHPLKLAWQFGALVDCLESGGSQRKFVPGITFQAIHAPPPANCPCGARALP